MLDKIIIALVALMPITIMTSQTIPSALFYGIALLSLILLITHKSLDTHGFTRNHKPVLISLSIFTLVVLFAGIWHGKLAGLDLEIALRFFLGVWLLGVAFSYIPKNILVHSIWGFLIAGLIASIYIIGLVLSGENRPQTSAVYNAVGYGSLTALLMIIALFSTRYHISKYIKTELIFKIALVLICFLAVVLTQTRTAWVAMPLFILVGAILFTPYKPGNRKSFSKSTPAKIIGLAIIAFIAIGTVFISSDKMRHRANLAYNEAVNCVGDQSTTDNSICIRLQLWRAALDMTSERPIAGNGSKRYFNDYLQNESYPKGLVSTYVAKGWGEPHNDLLLALSSFGIPGGIALLLIYLAPSIVFLKRLSFRNTPEARAAAAMGICLCLGFMIFGFTETMFRSMRTVSFYAMGTALFLVLSRPESVQIEN